MARTMPSHETPSHEDLFHESPSREDRSHENFASDQAASDNPADKNPVHENPSTRSALNHIHNPVTLPAVARTAARPAISIRRILPTRAQSAANRSKSPITLHPLAPFHPFKYISVYGSPDFPNRDYDYSWTAGARITFRFARHWSVSTGFQYEQLNVPWADVGGLATMPFHFSNYSIPLLMGYTTSFDRYRLTVTGGAFFNIYAKPVGSNISNTRFGGVPVDRDGHAMALGFDLERPINDRWAVFIQPYAREQIFNGEIYLPSRTITNGVLLGGRYHL
jgi:hypothetical protein